MEKERITSLGLIDNRDTNNPVNASCDHVIDKNGNVIFKTYTNIYKLTYKHIYKYKRISSIATDVILDAHYNSYIPLYYLYYFDINEEEDDRITSEGVEAKRTDEVDEEGRSKELQTVNEKRDEISTTKNELEKVGAEKQPEEFMDEVTYNLKCPKKNFIRYDLNEMLLLRFLVCNNERDIEGELSKHCFLKERKPIVNKIMNGSPIRYHREKSLNASLNIGLNDIAALSNSNNSALSSAALNNAALNFNSSGHLRNIGINAGDDPMSSRFLNGYQSPSLNTILTLNALTQLNQLHQLNQINSASPLSSQRAMNSLNPLNSIGHVGSMQPNSPVHSLGNIGNIGNKIFKNIDDNYYNAPTNNIYIDKEGKMHLLSNDMGGMGNIKGGYNYNYNNNNTNNSGSNNRMMHNRFDRTGGGFYNNANINTNNRERDTLGDFDYSGNFGNAEKGLNRKNGAEKYWDNPINYPKGTPVDIFTLGDIKKYAKSGEMRRNNNSNNNSINFNDNNYSIFKDNEEDNLTKSNFAKWFKNSNTNTTHGNENTTSTNYVDGKNVSDDTINTIANNTNAENSTVNDRSNNNENTNDIKWNTKKALGNRKGNENEGENENDNKHGSDSDDENEEEKIKGTVAELLVKQISVLKERSLEKELEHRASFDFFHNSSLSNGNVDVNVGLSGDHELYGKEAGRRLLEMFKNYNTGNEGHPHYQHSKARNNMVQSNVSPLQYRQHPGAISAHHLQQLQQIQQMQQLQQMQRQYRANNVKVNTFHNKMLSAEHFGYRKGYGVENYLNGNTGNMNFSHAEYQMPNKRMGRSRDSLNNFMFAEKTRNVAHNYPPYQCRNNIANTDVYVKGAAIGGGVGGGGGGGVNVKSYSYNTAFDMNRNRHKNKSQGNINITPIINSLLHIDNDYEHSEEDLLNNHQDAYYGNNLHYGGGGGGGGGVGFNNHNAGNYIYGSNGHSSHSISENIQNAKVNNVLESLKSLLKASKGHGGINEYGGGTHNNNLGTGDDSIHNDTYNNMNISKGFNNSGTNGADDHGSGGAEVFVDANSAHVFQMQHGQQQQRSAYKDINKNMFFKKEKFNAKYQEQENTGGNGTTTQKKW